MKKLFLIALIISMLLVVNACNGNVNIMDNENFTYDSISSSGYQDTNAETERDPEDKTIKIESIDVKGKKVIGTMGSLADFAYIYRDIKDLAEKAEYIVKGEVIAIEYFNVLGHAKTNLSVRINKSYKGDLIKDDVISVIEPGGINTVQNLIDYYGEMRFSDLSEYEKKNGIVYDYFNGAPHSKVGDDVILFLAESKGMEITKGAYSSLGAFMGKYTLKNGYYERYNPHPDFYNSINKNDSKNIKFDAKIMDAKIGEIIKTRDGSVSR